MKLEHDCIWRAITILSWSIVIFLASIFFAGWTQVIYPWIFVEKRSSFAFVKLQAFSAVQVIYLLLGVWFGILYRLMDYAWRIRRRIAGIE